MPALTGHALSFELSESLVEVVVAARILIYACIEDLPTPGSRAARDQNSAVNGEGWRGSTAVRNVYEDIYFIALAGIDHAAALAKLLQLSPNASVSVATLARGCVEALGRVFWVISADSPLQLVGRYSHIAHADLGDLAKVRPSEPSTLNRE